MTKWINEQMNEQLSKWIRKATMVLTLFANLGKFDLCIDALQYSLSLLSPW